MTHKLVVGLLVINGVGWNWLVFGWPWNNCKVNITKSLIPKWYLSMTFLSFRYDFIAASLLCTDYLMVNIFHRTIVFLKWKYNLNIYRKIMFTQNDAFLWTQRDYYKRMTVYNYIYVAVYNCYIFYSNIKLINTAKAVSSIVKAFLCVILVLTRTGISRLGLRSYKMSLSKTVYKY